MHFRVFIENSKFLLFMMNTTTNKQAGAREWHPFQEIVSRQLKLLENEKFERCFDFVRDISDKPCRDSTSGHEHSRSCHCLSILQDKVALQAAVAKYMADFIAKPQQERHSIIMERLR